MREYLLNNGVGIPVLGFGTWKAQDGEEAYQATLAALKAGYRHIDTAAIYKNEESVGRAIKDSGIGVGGGAGHDGHCVVSGRDREPRGAVSRDVAPLE